MPMTYVEVVRRLQQRSIDTLKVAQDAQLLTLRAARDSTLSGPALPVARDVTDWALALSYRLMAQQASYAKRFVDAFAQPSEAGVKPAPQAIGAASTTPPPVEIAVATAPLVALAAPEHVDLSATPANVDLLAAPANVEQFAAPANVELPAELTPAETLNATSPVDALHASAAAEPSAAIPAVETAADLVNAQILTPPFAEPGPHELVDEHFVPTVSSDDDFVLKVSTKPHTLGETADQDMRPVKKQVKVPAVSTNSMPPKRTPKKPPKPSH